MEDFMAALASAGYRPKTGQVISDGRWHRLYFMDEGGGRDSGRYILRVYPDGFALASYGSEKDPAGFRTWHPKLNKPMTADERVALSARIRSERAKAEAEDEALHLAAAEEALAFWRSLPPATGNTYSERKQITLPMARQDGSSLIVPMYDSAGRLWSLQTITEGGDKLFWWRAQSEGLSSRCKGVYCPLADKDDPKDTIILAEGYATACSVREATGLPVVVCFTAGNLEPVAVAVRKKFPAARLLIAADSDQWTLTTEGHARAGRPDRKAIRGDDPLWEEWRENGWLLNTGMDKAARAAALIGGAHIVEPGFPSDDPEKGTDFNDAAVRIGTDYVRDRILGVLTQTRGSAPAPDEATGGIHGSGHDLQPVGGTPFDGGEFELVDHEPNWRELAIWKRTSKGEMFLDPDKGVNYGLLVEHELAGVFAFDEFRLSVIVKRCPPWCPADRFKVHIFEDVDVTECDYWLQRKGLNGSDQKTRSAIFRAALMNPVHPARDFFDDLRWDGVRRLDNWLIDICGAEEDDPDYLRAVGSKWLIAAVARVFDPGCKFDHMLILEGGQSKFKTTALEELATFGDPGMEERYFTSDFRIKNAKDKDELLKLWGCLIIEVGEMAGFGESDIEEVKNFLTIKQDRIRIPYSRLPKDYKRQFVFAGTRNPVGGLFKDPTGARRFWPVEVGTIDIALLRRDKAQIWAEAVHRYKGGESLALTDALYAKCAEAAKARYIHDEWTHDVLEKVGESDFVTVREILRETWDFRYST